MSTIDIIMATYNGEAYIAEQIESILWQDYKDWNLLVSDDCSTDGTLDVVRKYEKRDSRIRIVSEGMRYGSAKSNFMHLLTISDAPYVMFCDQDDIWLPEKIRITFARMRELEASRGDEVPKLVFSDMAVVDEWLNIIASSFMKYANYDPSRRMLHNLLPHNVAAGCTMMFNSTLRELIKCCVDVKSIEMHDWWTILVAATLGATDYVDTSLSLYRQHRNNTAGADRYSPLKRMLDMPTMIDHYFSTVQQAHALIASFRECLRGDQLRIAEDYIAASQQTSVAKAVALLVRSGCWKHGARKLGQLAVLIEVVRSNRVSQW